MNVILWLLRWAVADRRKPDIFIGGETDTYLRRWWVIPRNRFFNIYLHNMLRDDDDRALHDHPWINCSIVLSGGYWEHIPNRRPSSARPELISRIWRGPGSIVFRRPTAAHRLELGIGWSGEGVMDAPVPVRSWSLFITGPVVRDWGFWCPKGWRHWRDFTSGPRGETIGRGCD